MPSQFAGVAPWDGAPAWVSAPSALKIEPHMWVNSFLACPRPARPGRMRKTSQKWGTGLEIHAQGWHKGAQEWPRASKNTPKSGHVGGILTITRSGSLGPMCVGFCFPFVRLLDLFLHFLCWFRLAYGGNEIGRSRKGQLLFPSSVQGLILACAFELLRLRLRLSRSAFYTHALAFGSSIFRCLPSRSQRRGKENSAVAHAAVLRARGSAPSGLEAFYFCVLLGQ